MSDDQATAPLLSEVLEDTSLAPAGASTRPAGEITGLISATGDVELPELIGEAQREPEEERVAPEQQIIEGAATIFGLNGGGGGSSGGGGGQSKPSEGVLANVIRSVIGAPFYPLKLVQVHFCRISIIIMLLARLRFLSPLEHYVTCMVMMCIQ
jgi:hypothetical protein